MFEINISLKTLIMLTLLCITGIIVSIFAIDKQIDSYIADMRAEITIVNNTDNYVDMTQEGNETTIIVNPNENDDSGIIEETETPEDNEMTEKETVDYYCIISSEKGINIRQEPSINSEKVGTYYYGAKVKILEDCGDWYKTESGYIFKEYVIRI